MYFSHMGWSYLVLMKLTKVWVFCGGKCRREKYGFAAEILYKDDTNPNTNHKRPALHLA